MNRISASRLQTICAVLGVPVSFFFDEGGRQTTNDTVDQSPADGMKAFLSSNEGLNLNRAFIAIKDKEARRAIVALVKAAANGEDVPNSETEVADTELP